ncbi:MAG TPA: SemiSWEET transporter [Syntrophorhabdaceae bacterium]|nr:SemiSWEET transporter [Syntrophorhabdaceae bacterium]HOD74645.1 SemiSWEET transporter [Syntrophorhabdaceae bacterium]
MADLIGYIAACFTTFSLLPQILRIRRLKEARDVSLFLPLMIVIGSVLWSVYGILISSIPVIVANGVALIIALITVFFTIRYR